MNQVLWTGVRSAQVQDLCGRPGEEPATTGPYMFESCSISSEKQGILLQICYNPYETGYLQTFYITKTKL